ncbi:ABC transporter permease [Marinobacterium arenosum]|uniref:ABC transporter permease n=1 Tax=Marinobacterium arenosum TaxID=2862496 RepID=UPI001C975B3F|nr:ABC transporter permease [Marinobacterium arenosum]MBY4676798.1 ABC transporter permease [Marinobacterium arenosum]
MNKALLINFVRQDLIDRYSGSLLGGAWSFVMPLVNILIFVLIFSKIMGARLEILGAEFAEYSYSIFLVTGILGWNALSNTISRVTNVFSDKASLIGKVNISLVVMPVYIVLTETIIFAISYLFFMFFILLIGFPLSWHFLLIPLIFVVQQLMAYALGFICAVLSVFFRDIREFVSVILQLWFWLTPIVYVVNILPEKVRIFFMLNPAYHLVTAYRDLVMYQRMPDWTALSILFATSALLLMLGVWMFRKLERDIRDFI